jgi:hypothetical protein
MEPFSYHARGKSLISHLLSQARHGADQVPVNYAPIHLVWEKLQVP